jgi:hypothetical protein
VHARKCRCPDNLDSLIQSSDGQGGLVVLFAGGKSLSLSVGVVVARDGDVASVDGAVVPLGLDDVSVRDKHATDDGQYDEEDACAGIASGCGWRPLGGEERCAVVVCEGHGHGVGHAGHAAAGG